MIYRGLNIPNMMVIDALYSSGIVHQMDFRLILVFSLGTNIRRLEVRFSESEILKFCGKVAGERLLRHVLPRVSM